MAGGLRLQVVTRERRVVDVEADEVQLPGADGELGILPGHTPLLTTLGIGVLSYRGRGVEGAAVVAGGFAEVLSDQVTVLAELAEKPDEVDAAAARGASQAAAAAMRSATAEELDQLVATLRLAEARLAVVDRRTRGA